MDIPNNAQSLTAEEILKCLELHGMGFLQKKRKEE